MSDLGDVRLARIGSSTAGSLVQGECFPRTQWSDCQRLDLLDKLAPPWRPVARCSSRSPRSTRAPVIACRYTVIKITTRDRGVTFVVIVG